MHTSDCLEMALGKENGCSQGCEEYFRVMEVDGILIKIVDKWMFIVLKINAIGQIRCMLNNLINHFLILKIF